MGQREWTPAATRRRVDQVQEAVLGAPAGEIVTLVESLAARSHEIHDVECINLNPATNVMNPRAEALQAAGLGPRASLGQPADKYETGLEAIEQIEVIAAALACDVFGSRFAEVRVGSGALGNLYSFMATCEPGDRIIAPPPSIGGHVTHHGAGAAGLYRLETIAAPVDPSAFTVDVDALADLARSARPRLITVGGSLNLFPHPVEKVREIADSVGARVLFDAAHLCGMIAGRVWPNPLAAGADLMSLSTYKSLGGPAGGLVVTDDADLAQRLDAIAYPGLTANHDAGRVAALAVTLADWQAVGGDYAARMVELATALAHDLSDRGIPLFAAERGFTRSHQFAVLAERFGGGQHAARRMRRAGLLACGIGLPVPTDRIPDGDTAGLRIGTPELARIGMRAGDMTDLGGFITRSLTAADDESAALAALAAEVAQWRSQFTGVHFTTDLPH